MMKSTNESATYVIDEDLAARLRLAVYQLAAAVDELLWRSRVEPGRAPEPGHEESVFWEAHSELLSGLRRHSDDDHF